MDALKLYNVTACLDSTERLFQYFTPLNEKHFWPFAVLNSGSFKSVEVFRMVRRDLCEFSLLEYKHVICPSNNH